MEGSVPCCLWDLKLQERDSSSTTPVLRALNNTAQDPAISPGQEEIGKAQDSEDTPASRCPQAAQMSAPASREHPGLCRVGELQ